VHLEFLDIVNFFVLFLLVVVMICLMVKLLVRLLVLVVFPNRLPIVMSFFLLILSKIGRALVLGESDLPEILPVVFPCTAAD
jgi:hypothetical protein